MRRKIGIKESSSLWPLLGWLLFWSFALSLLMTIGCASPPVQNPTGQAQQPIQNPVDQSQEPIRLSPDRNLERKTVSKEESQEIALAFLRNSPTFRFDGMGNTLKLVGSEAGEKPGSWVFRYQFQSQQAGYGDRTGMILAQVITDHRAEIIVEQGQVVYAVLDGRWDELRQKMIQ